jgi:hypothetical protein
MASPLAEVASRAGLVPSGPADGERCEATYEPKWPGQVVTLTASAAELRGLLDAAAADVPDLWPGHDAADGAISLVATGLQSVLDARAVPARLVRLSGGRWVAEPPEPAPAAAPYPGHAAADPLEWRAPER